MLYSEVCVASNNIKPSENKQQWIPPQRLIWAWCPCQASKPSFYRLMSSWQPPPRHDLLAQALACAGWCACVWHVNGVSELSPRYDWDRGVNKTSARQELAIHKDIHSVFADSIQHMSMRISRGCSWLRSVCCGRWFRGHGQEGSYLKCDDVRKTVPHSKAVNYAFLWFQNNVTRYQVLSLKHPVQLFLREKAHHI